MIGKFLQKKFLETEMLVISVAISKLPFEKECGHYSAIHTHCNVPNFLPEAREFFSPSRILVFCFSHVTCFL